MKKDAVVIKTTGGDVYVTKASGLLTPSKQAEGIRDNTRKHDWLIFPTHSGTALVRSSAITAIIVPVE